MRAGNRTPASSDALAASPWKTLAAILLVSGFCSLVYQMVWLRTLRLVFGASTLSSAAVLAIFMGGLGVGGWVFGRRVDRSARPLTFYSRLELGIATTAALTPILVSGIQIAYVSLGGTPRLGTFGGTVLRLALSVLVLGGPAFLMGGTLPAAVRAVERAGDRGRRTVGWLYGINTLGAVLGTLWATFVSIEWLGLQRSIWLAALTNLLIALCARSLARSRESGTESGTEAGTEAGAEEGTGANEPASSRSPSPDQDQDEVAGGRLALVLAAAFLMGFVFFLMELVWYRMLGPLLGGTSYTFGLILATALLGIGAGGLAYGLGARERRPTLLTFAGTCALLAVAVGLPFALGDHIAFLALTTRDLGQAGLAGMIFSWFLVTGLVVLPASLVAGYQFPLLVSLLGTGSKNVGREVGLAYLWNTAGSILGSVAGGFGLLPLLTAPGAWRLSIVLLALLATAYVVVALRTGPPTTPRPPDGSETWRRLPTAPIPAALIPAALAIALSAGLASTTGPTAAWRHTGIGAGRMEAPEGGPNSVRAALVLPRNRLVWEEEGLESSVALSAELEYYFQINGKTDGSALSDAPTQVMSGLVGAALHPQPRKSLVIGLGTGSSAGWLADVPGMERVDVVELEPAVARIAEWMAAVNRNALDNPRLHLQFGDAREYLLTTRSTYDIIFSEPSNPYRAGISSLFSRELYEAAAERLDTGGIFVQWLQGYEVDASVVRTAYATLLSVFPHVESWRVHYDDLLLVAAPHPIPHDAERIRRRVAQEPFVSGLENTWGVSGLEGFYSGYLAGPGFARQVAGQPWVELNTDDHPVIEFGFVRNLGRGGLFSMREMEDLAHREGHDRADLVRGTVNWERVRNLESARSVVLRLEPPIVAPGETRPTDDRRVYARRAYYRADHDQVVAHWFAQTEEPEGRADRLMLSHSLARTSDPRAPEHIARLRETRPLEADAALALYHAIRQEKTTAVPLILGVLQQCRTQPWIHPPLLHDVIHAATGLGRNDPQIGRRMFQALSEPFAAGLMHEVRQRARLDLAVGESFAPFCLEALEALEPHVFWEHEVLLRRVRCYQMHGDPRAERALDDLVTFLAHEPPPLLSGRDEP